MVLSESFTTEAALLAVAGGALLGVSSMLLLLFNGRVGGVSGIVSAALPPVRPDGAWRYAFLIGLVIAGVVGMTVAPDRLAPTTTRGLEISAAAGLLVGIGTTLGTGCTSGHGVSGLSRLSVRAFVAVAAFMATGMLTASLVQVVFGGEL